MRHNNKILFKLMLVGAIALGGCNKYLDVNTDPNRPTDANITAELIFTQAENGVGGRMASGNFLFINHWVGYSAQNGTFAPQQNEISYNIDFSFCNPIYVNNMDVLFDLQQAKLKGLASGDTGVAAASMILSVKLWQDLVDLYGNIPYFQAFQNVQYPTPAYDKAQTIYDDLQLKLDSAITYFGSVMSSKFGPADIIAAGKVSTWIKFANTLKLRLLIRQSEVSGFSPAAVIAKIDANGGGFLGTGESISVNPGYLNDVNKQNPFYANFGWSPTGVVSTSSDNANDYIITLLGNVADPRIERFYYPVGFAGPNFAGAKYGDVQEDIPTAANLSYFGPALVGGIDEAHVGDGTGAVQSQWIVPSYESLFWQAEAVTRGWLPGTAKTAYENAVIESFLWLGLDTTTAKTFLATVGDPTINWDEGAAGQSVDVQVKFIAYQKYIANTMIDPLESFLDINRLNMLTDDSYISANPARLSNTLPVRLLYPQSEYTTNATNVNAEGTINQFTSKLFWEP